MLKNLLFLLPVVFLLTVFPLFSQEDVLDHKDQPESEVISPDNDGLYVITEFEFNIKGRTRPYALIYVGEFREGEKLQGRANLEKYISDKTQVLINQRVLEDNASIGYSIGEQLEDGSYPVTLMINVEDSWNVIALPKPAYSTNTGFDLTIKARDYNFLGTMNPLRIDLGYNYDENRRTSFMLGVFSSTPFRALGLIWNFRFDNIISYRPDVDESYYYQNVVGLSVEVPYRTTTFTFGFEEYFNYNEENSDRYKIKYDEFQKGLYMTSKPYISWKIPTGLEIYGELTYTPGISAIFNHELPDWPLQEFRKGPFMEFTHTLGFEKIDWHANFRQGLSVSVSNTYTYDFFRLNNNQDPLSSSVAFNGTGHLVISRFFAVSSRFMYQRWFYHDPGYYDQAGDALRGIPDNAICADYMMSLNMDFPLRILVFSPSEWLHNSKYHFFDFELHASPVIDMALYHDPVSEISFDRKNMITTGGLEFIVFPAFMRSLYVRLGYVCNLRELLAARPVKFPGDATREIYLIMGHFY